MITVQSNFAVTIVEGGPSCKTFVVTYEDFELVIDESLLNISSSLCFFFFGFLRVFLISEKASPREYKLYKE